MRRIASMILLLLLAVEVGAAALRAPAQQALEMKKVQFLVGKWSGKGWFTRGQRRHIFEETKEVQSKLKGRVLLIEGSQRVILGEGRKTQPLDVLAVLSYDEKEQVYRFRTHVATGFAGDHTARMVDGVLEWRFDDPNRGPTRYRIRQDEKGRWVETGESSPDGKVWEQFYENILERAE